MNINPCVQHKVIQAIQTVRVWSKEGLVKHHAGLVKA